MAELQPTVEDCYSDDSEGGSIPFQGRRSPNAANVSTKRSHPSDLDKQMPPAQERAPTNIDLRSDSGYSSYTTATVSSTNSAQSAPPQRSPPQVPAAAAPAPPQPEAPKARRRPTDQTEKTSKSSSSSRPKPSARTPSSKTPAIVQTQPPERKRRPTVNQDSLSRPERRDRRDSRVEPDGAEPRRTKYDPNAPASAVRRRPDIQPSQSARDVNRPIPQDTRSMHSDPASYQQAPPSPTHYRQAYYGQGAAVIQPATTRRRPSMNGRPMSYGGEAGPQYHWTQGGPGYPTPPPERGPPLSSSAHYSRGFAVPPVGQMGPPQTPYGMPPGYPPQFYQMPYDDGQRPGMPQRSSSNAARRGPAPPVINQAPREQQYSTRYGQPQMTHPRMPAPLQLDDRAHESDTESETGSSEDDEYYGSEHEVNPNDPRAHLALMPPPPAKAPKTKSNSKTKPKTKKSERPPLPHAYTTTTVEKVRNHRHSMSTPPVVVDERSNRHRSTKSTNEPSRRLSVSRPPPPAHTQTEYPARRGSVYVGDSTKAERRRSAHYGQSARDKEYAEFVAERQQEEARLAAEDQAQREAKAARRARKALEERYQADQAARAEQERKREKRNSKVYYQPPAAFDDSEEEYESDEPVAPAVPEPPIAPRRRRPTDVGGRKPKEVQAIDYMNNQRGTDAPLNDHIHRAAKRASRVPSMPSHSGSSGSDRQSQSNRTALTSNGNNEIRLRVDANAPLSLQFNGDMEGRTMQLIPTEDGMAELVISGSRDNESNYHSSERGSNAGDGQALVTRSQLEEMTKASMRSDRRRRESRTVRDSYDDRIVEVPRPLRRRANTSSHYYN
ncbi:hypothetical protein J4E89_001300 [Alternaria sp. Ai002NY15]|nr:hypothetical protein J4E89_001300 [Alternaria sp. Ai002NY15]